MIMTALQSFENGLHKGKFSSVRPLPQTLSDYCFTQVLVVVIVVHNFNWRASFRLMNKL